MAVLKKITLALVTLTLLYAGVGFVVRCCTSDETRIRQLVAGMAEAYDSGHPGECVAPLARDWHHEGYEFDRELLRGALFQTSMERDPETRALLSKVTLDANAAVVTVTGAHATLACEATFARFRRDVWEDTWRLHVEAELTKGDDGWKITKSRHQDLRGTQLGR